MVYMSHCASEILNDFYGPFVANHAAMALSGMNTNLVYRQIPKLATS